MHDFLNDYKSNKLILYLSYKNGKRMKSIFKTAGIAFLALSGVMSAASCSKMFEGAGMSVQRTVLVYMAADNNLSGNARRDIEEMKDGYVPYYFDEGSGDVLLVYADIQGEKPKLMRLSRDRFGTVNVEILREYEDQNSCSDTVMRAVLSYAAGLFPSEENGLVLWSHGTGWLPEGYYSNPYSADPEGVPVPMDVPVDPYAGYVKSFGADNGHEMDIKDLAGALPIRYSYILIDACLMGGIEVAYELKNNCDYFVGSAAEILADGFPYSRVMEYLFGGREGLERACWEFYDYYKEDGATIALVDTRKLNALAESCLDIFLSGRVAIPTLDMDSLQGYYRMGRHWFYDLDDFVGRIASRDTVDGQSRSQYDVFRSALDEAVVYKRATEEFMLGGVSQFTIKQFSGLSTYVPDPENTVLNMYYRSLAWNLAVRMVD